MTCPKCKKDNPQNQDMCPDCDTPAKPIPVLSGSKNHFKDYEIVELSLDDLPNCSSFWGYPNSRLEKFLKSGERKVFACKTSEEYVGGCALIIRDNQSGHFSDFCVREDLRGNGIGSRILEFALDCFNDNSIKTIRLHVLKNNLSAIKLYEKYGFKYFEDMTLEKIAMVRTFY